MKHFKEREFACKCCGGLPRSSSLGQTPRANIKALVDNVLDPAREAYGAPIYVNSGYRCPKHNAEVGGVARSQHLIGEAADIRCADNRLLQRIIIDLDNFDQLIIYPTFLHVSYRRTGKNSRRIIIKNH